MLTDTHTHLYLEEFDADGCEAAVDRAVAAGVGHMLLPNVDLSTIAPMKALHAARPDVTSMAMGFHPTEVREDWRDAVARVTDELRSAPAGTYVAVGEIGVDLYWDATFESQQMQALERQFGLAASMELPVIIHCRSGLDQTLEVLSEFGSLQGVMHSFGGTPAEVEKVLKVNERMRFGINGIVTFKNSRVAESLPAITARRLLLETDSPYLAPVPHRGHRCESAMLPLTAARCAEALGMTAEALAKVTTANARALFNF